VLGTNVYGGGTSGNAIPNNSVFKRDINQSNANKIDERKKQLL